MNEIPINIRAKAEIELRRRQESRINTSFKDWLKKVTPKYNWEWPHLQLIFKELELVASGKVKKLMIYMPPRHGKSETVSIRFPAWYIERYPETKFIIAGYNFDLSSKFSRKAQRIVKSQGIPLSREAVDDWQTNQDGGIRSVGVGSGVTGHGAFGIIIDDPVKSREEAYSSAYREKVWNWYRDDLFTRLEPQGFIILIMTRWHQDDLAGRILENDKEHEWKVLKLPALAEENDPMGRSVGEALCPDRFDEDALEYIKTVQGSDFESLYQQNPVAATGSIFKREWWKYYDVEPQFNSIYQSWDTGFKLKQSNDPSCCLTWGVTNSGYYLIHRWVGRVAFPDLKVLANQLYQDFHPTAVLIEDKASGQSLIQELQRETSIPLVPIQVGTDKISRANAVTPIIQSGRVYLPKNKEWVFEYVDQMAGFPAGAHDEDIDCTSQLLNYLSHQNNIGMLNFYEQQHNDWVDKLSKKDQEIIRTKQKKLADKLSEYDKKIYGGYNNGNNI
jgi:predicted phage terminase large subunit-like protein